MNAYLIELRRSPLLTAFPLLVAVDLLVLFGRSRYWIGVWPEASVAAQVVTIFLGPLLAGVSAWQAGRSSRSGMPETILAAARPIWRIEAARLAATLTLGLVAYMIGCLTAAGISLSEAGPGFLWPSYLLLGMATLVIFASVGHLAGRWWPSAGFTPIVCALGCFISMLALPIKFNVLAGPPDQHLRPLPVAMRLLFALALAVLAVTAPPLRRSAERQMPRQGTPWHIRCAAGGSAVLTLIALAAASAAGELRVDRPATAVEPVCERAEKGSPEVCVWPEHRKYLPDLTLMAQRLDHSESWLKSPQAFHEFGLRRSDLGDGGFDIAEGHVRTAAIAMADQVFAKSLGRCSPPPEENRVWQAMDNIRLWLEYRSMGQDPSVSDKGLHMQGVEAAQNEAARVSRASQSDQREWLAQERSYILEDPTWCTTDDQL
ncbi:ABC transporter permease [Streptomyces sp. NPDC026589]|uniref:ABC transporter permease n=1 Tax=Streptomyces sp. NPDC026589 TaxID=3155609 RepID=UPI0033CABCEE